MSSLLERLQPKERRASKPRCHLLTQGSPNAVAARLTALVAPFARVASSDRWKPEGFGDLEETQLHKAPRLLPPALRLPGTSRGLNRAAETVSWPNARERDRGKELSTDYPSHSSGWAQRHFTIRTTGGISYRP